MNKKETFETLEKVKKILFDTFPSFPKNVESFVRITNIDLDDFDDICKGLKITVDHPDFTVGENRLMAIYHYAYGDIILKSEPVKVTVQYLPTKE